MPKEIDSEQQAILNLTLFQNRIIKGKDGRKNSTVTTCIPMSIKYDDTMAYQFQKVIDMAIIDAVISRFEELVDTRGVQAIEYYLNENGLSLSRLCQQAQKISDALYSIFQEGARPVVEEILEVAHQTFGFKYDQTNNAISDHLKLAQSLANLNRMVIELGLQRGLNEQNIVDG